MEKTILRTEKLEIGYNQKGGKKVIASNIDLALEPGKLVTLVGANGIGKSTFLRTITGLQQPLSGSIFVDNQSLSTYDAKTLAKKLSVVLTDPLPPGNLTVFELVALGRQPYTNWLGTLNSLDSKKVNEALDLVRISELTDRKHHELSDGQLQKALIARALAQDTPLIILDEPTTHLDLAHTAELYKLLKSLVATTGKLILLSTHDLDLAIQVSDEMLIMTKSGIVHGTPEMLLQQNVFNTIFDQKVIEFDQDLRKFIFKNL